MYVWNVTNGARFETYASSRRACSGVICLNGPGGLRAEVGHKVIIAAFAFTDQPVMPKVALLDEEIG